ncbi:hypothetical protein KH5_06660 [Urechidicola sp. KH5]
MYDYCFYLSFDDYYPFHFSKKVSTPKYDIEPGLLIESFSKRFVLRIITILSLIVHLKLDSDQLKNDKLYPILQ